MIELPISGPTPFPNVPSTLWARIGQQCEHFLARLVQQQQKWHEQTSRSHTINTYSYYHNYHHHFLEIGYPQISLTVLMVHHHFLDLNFHFGVYPIYRHTQMKGIHFSCNFQIFSFTIHNSLATLKPHLRPTIFLTTHTACTRLEWHGKNDVGWGNNKRCRDKSYKQCRAPYERWQKEFKLRKEKV